MNDNGTLWLPEQGSTLAPEIDGLFYFVYWVGVVLFALVIGCMIYFAFRYRRRSHADRPEPVHESKWMEAAWIVVPTILVLVIFTWGFRAFIDLQVAPPNSYEIDVQAQKWAWQFKYPNGAVTTDTLRVPVGRPVRLRMNSVDVLHSFFVPAFRVKQDVLPNRYTAVWFEATKQDTFQVFCTEYCGTLHSSMLANVVALGQDEFNAWLETGGVDPSELDPVEYGALLYRQQACVGCHSVDGSDGVGPTFQGLYGAQRQFEDGTSAVADDNYLRESIVEPSAKIVQGYPPVMPPNYASLTEDQLAALIAFIEAQQ